MKTNKTTHATKDHDRNGSAIWNVNRVAVDEPEEGESGTIYEYQVRYGSRVVFTTYNEADALETISERNAAPELLDALRLSIIELYRDSAANGESGNLARAIVAARAAIAKAEGGC